jgi:hypothetical protein
MRSEDDRSNVHMTDQGREYGAVIDELRQFAEKLGDKADSDIHTIVSSWLSREAHLAMRRAYEMMADGVPPDTAFFLAVDDSGFQLAAAYTAQITNLPG